jgi:hypothetical protein
MSQFFNINNIDEPQLPKENLKIINKHIIKYEIDKESHYIEFFGSKNILVSDIKYMLRKNKDLKMIIKRKLFCEKDSCIYKDYINNLLITDIKNIKINDIIPTGIYNIFIESKQKNNCIIQLTIM